jgi:uncharacterized membrane protein
MADSFMGDFKRFFGRGLAILLPTIVTLWILWQAFSFVYTNVAEPINRATRMAVIWAVPQIYSPQSAPEWYTISEEEIRQAKVSDRFRANTPDALVVRDLRREWLRRYWSDNWWLNLTGFFVAILLIYMAGLLLSNFFGRSLYHRVERLIAAIPGFKQVYPHVKQVVDLVMGEKKMAFSKVVLVEYPSAGIWTLGFLTGDSLRAIDLPAGGRVSSVFIPTSPTPFTGFTINVRSEKVIVVDVSVEEALRFVITAGVLTPETAAIAGTVSGGPRTIAAKDAGEAAARVRAGVGVGSGESPPAGSPTEPDPDGPRA